MFIVDENICTCWPTKSKELYWTEDLQILYFAKYHETERIRWPIIVDDRYWREIWNFDGENIKRIWILLHKY